MKNDDDRHWMHLEDASELYWRLEEALEDAKKSGADQIFVSIQEPYVDVRYSYEEHDDEE